MKKVILMGSLLATGLMPVLASAADKAGPYAALNGQAVFAEDSEDSAFGIPFDTDYDTGYGIGGALGYDLPGSGLRLEGEVTYRNNEATIESPIFFGDNPSGDADSIAYMANAYYDIDTNSRFTPYIGAGAGVVDIDNADTVFAYQGMTGVAYSLNDKSEIYGGYRYFGSEGVDLGESVNVDYNSHNAEVGYRLRF